MIRRDSPFVSFFPSPACKKGAGPVAYDQPRRLCRAFQRVVLRTVIVVLRGTLRIIVAARGRSATNQRSQKHCSASEKTPARNYLVVHDVPPEVAVLGLWPCPLTDSKNTNGAHQLRITSPALIAPPAPAHHRAPPQKTRGPAAHCSQPPQGESHESESRPSPTLGLLVTRPESRSSPRPRHPQPSAP